MARVYGLRAASNFADVADNSQCLTNLGLTIADFLAIAGVAATGVTANDFRALIGLRSGLEAQITGLVGSSASLASGLATRASRYGDTISGITTVAGFVTNDRAFVSTVGSGRIYGAASGSFFSPFISNPPTLLGESPSYWIRPAFTGTIDDLMVQQYGFGAGASYRAGPTRISGLTVSSGLGNYSGNTFAYGLHYEPYKIHQQILNSGNVAYAIKTQLPPPTVFSGCCLWLDTEKSTLTTSGSRVTTWGSVILNGPVGSQSTLANAPFYLPSGIVDSGVTKPTISFSGFSEFMTLGSIGGNFADGATVVVMAEIRGGDYCILSNSISSQGRWRTTSGNGSWPLFCSGTIPRFPAAMPANGTIAFSVRASQAFGLEIRSNGQRLDYIAPSGFTYSTNGEYLLGTAIGNAGRLNGALTTVVAFNRILPDRELRTVEEYAMWRYNSVYNPDKSQVIQLEDGATLELEDGNTVEAG